LPQLVALSLSHNRLTALPGGVGSLTRLEVLNVAHNRLTALPPSLGADNPALTHLDAGHNRLRFPLPSPFSRLPVEYLDVRGNASLMAVAGSLRGRSSVELACALVGSPVSD